MFSPAVITFLLFLLLFVLIGALSVLKSNRTNDDYLIASRNIPPWLAALSAVATNNSGYMFIGQIGYTYKYGLSSIWLMFGWIVGDFFISLLVHKRLCRESAERGFLSFGGALSRWHGNDYRRLRLLVGIIIVIFLGTYAAAQFKAGSKALHVLFGWSYATGAIIGAVMVLIYCLAGGIRASIWTDAAQSFVMMTAMALLLLLGVDALGGIAPSIRSLNEVSPSYLSVWPEHLGGGAILIALWITGWIFAGFAIIGLPHVMIRFMALESPEKMPAVRLYYYSWYTLFYACAIGVGMLARVLLPESESFDAELALPSLSIKLLSPYLVGLILAGLFAATMSTADSLILSCSASITRDIMPSERTTLLHTKIATLAISALALLIALFGGSNVFNLVLIAISVLASAFAPLLILYCLDCRMSEATALCMMLVGVTTAILWRDFGLSRWIYEIAPGMSAGFLSFAVLRRSRWNASD